MSSMIETTDAVLADLNAERQVLGILIKYPREVDSVIDQLRPHHFYDLAHRRVYEIILDLYHKRGRISYTQVYNELRTERITDSPAEFLIALTESFVSLSELEPSAAILQSKYQVRRLVEAADQIRAAALGNQFDDVAELQSRAQQLIFDATQAADGEGDDARSLLEVLNKCYMNLIKRREGTDDAYGLSVRFPAIDAMTTGFKKKDLIILAARPSMGKTALAMNMAVNVAKRDIPVLIFSLEMDDEQIGDRIVLSEFFSRKQAGELEITSYEYQTKLSDEQFMQAQEVFNDLYHLPIRIVDKRGLTCAEIRAKARKVKAELPNLGLIVIDYLQLIKPPVDGNRNWALVIGEIVRELRDLAGELDLPIILLSQLNRGVESRENKRPMMVTRDSGNIEFADVVIFLYREDYYYPDLAAQNGTPGLVGDLRQERKTHGHSAAAVYKKEYTRFIDESPGR